MFQRLERVVFKVLRTNFRSTTLSRSDSRMTNIQEQRGKVPACLTVIRTLSRGLEKEPLVLEIFFGGRGVR